MLLFDSGEFDQEKTVLIGWVFNFFDKIQKLIKHLLLHDMVFSGILNVGCFFCEGV